MNRSRDAGEICGLCDEFDVDQATSDCAAQGMGRCMVRDARGPLHLHVAWDGDTCVSFRLDRPNLRDRRQFVEVQRRAQRAATATTAPD